MCQLPVLVAGVRSARASTPGRRPAHNAGGGPAGG